MMERRDRGQLRQAHQATAPIVPVKDVMSEMLRRLAECRKVWAEETKHEVFRRLVPLPTALASQTGCEEGRQLEPATFVVGVAA